MNTGIKYKKTGNIRRGQVSRYHQKPSPVGLDKTPYAIDTKGIKRQNIVRISDSYPFESRFTIGFEVEKTSLHRSTYASSRSNADREHILFCGIERDSSCGYEAVTHILPLLPKSKWRNKVLDLFYQSEKVIEDSYSPSNHKCGGHITIGVRRPDGSDMSGREIAEAMRKNLGIVYALFRKRLRNKYCGFDILFGMGDIVNSYPEYAGNSYNHWKYKPVLVKDNCVEFRLVSRFQSVKQTIRRYELFYEILDFTFNNPNGSHESLLKRIKPILMSMYENQECKVNAIMQLSRSFRAFLTKGRIDEAIVSYVDRKLVYQNRWTQGLHRANREVRGRNEYYTDNQLLEELTSYAVA